MVIQVGDKVAYQGGFYPPPDEYRGRVGTAVKIDFDGMVFVQYGDGTLLAFYPYELERR